MQINHFGPVLFTLSLLGKTRFFISIQILLTYQHHLVDSKIFLDYASYQHILHNKLSANLLRIIYDTNTRQTITKKKTEIKIFAFYSRAIKKETFVVQILYLLSSYRRGHYIISEHGNPWSVFYSFFRKKKRSPIVPQMSGLSILMQSRRKKILKIFFGRE